VSPQQAFDEFDVNQDGKLSRAEFVKALERMKIHDLSADEVDSLIASMDFDRDGTIRYKEFVRKLQRYGVRGKTSAEHIIELLLKNMHRTKKNLGEMFEIIDKEGKGYISREDFLSLFQQFDVKIPQGDLEKFVDHFWRDKAAGIDYKEFLRIFQRHELELKREGQREQPQISDNLIRRKKAIFEKMD